MSYDCATYSSEAAAIAGLKVNWINYLKEQVSADKPAKKPDESRITDLAGLTDEEISQLKLLGKRGGKIIDDDYSCTTAYNVSTKAYNIDLWYYSLPPSQYMVGVENCTTQTYQSSWEYPE